MRFGYHCASFHFPGPDAAAFDSVVALASRLESVGFEWFSTMDHLWQIPLVGTRVEPYFDAYTTLPAIARETTTLELGALVTCPHYRNPAMLGRQLTTLDHASGGRAVFGIGAGWFEAEYAAYGIEFPAPEQRVHDLRDTVNIVRAMWSDPSPVSLETDYLTIEELTLQPKPVQAGGPDVLIGGGGEDLTLKAVADLADRWNLTASDPTEFRRKLGIVEAYCDRFGRSFTAIEPTVLQTAVVRETTEAAHQAYEALQAHAVAEPKPRGGGRGLVGSPDDVIELITAYADRGAEMVMFWAPRNDAETIDTVIDAVLPSFE